MTTRSRLKRKERSVFISYARKDGSIAAKNLYEFLTKKGYDVWIDVERIHGGSSWSEEVENALTACDVLVAVLTRESYHSPMCRGEQIWALDEGKLVIPVLATKGSPIPIYLKSKQYRKYPEQDAELLIDISAKPTVVTPQRLQHYDTVPSLPKGYLLRQKALSELRNVVLAEGQDATIAVTALEGMGGIGKTVLATALCRDILVQRAFPDGIAWVTFGRDWNGDFLPKMREIGRALGESVEKGWDTQDACENRYRTILPRKAALVVVDDVWSLEQLQPMLVKSPRSRLLFTTRNAAIAGAISDRSFSADLLSELEARKLLARAAGITSAKLPPVALDIIAECRGLALAIAQIGGSLKGQPATDWIDTLEALQRADVSTIEERLDTGQLNFFRSLAVSIDSLPQEKKDRFLELAVLPEDASAPVAILQALWRLDERSARHTARYLVDRSLAFWATKEDPSSGIRLHDLQLDYVRAMQRDQTALELILRAARLSAYVIDLDPKQFSSQMVGRLLEHDQNESIASFVNTISVGAPGPWLRPLWPSLASLDGKSIPDPEGHLAGIVDVAPIINGRRLISASLDDTLKVWDSKTGKVLMTLRGHSLGVYSVSVSANGRRAISASLDKSLKLWDLKTGREIATIRAAHARGIACVVISADGRQAISASWDKTLKLWDLERRISLRTFKGHSKQVNAVAVSADWKIAVSASEDGTLRVWSVDTGSILRTLRGHTGDVWYVALTPNARLALSASEDKTLKLWDLRTGRQQRTYTGHSSAVYCVAMSRDGLRCVSASDDMAVKVWDLQRGKVLQTFTGHSFAVTSVAFNADGKSVVSGSYDASMKLWNTVTGSETRTFKGRSEALNAVAITADRRLAVFASDDTTIKVWDIEDHRLIGTLHGHLGDVSDVAVPLGSRFAASVSSDETLRVWDLVTGTEVQRLNNKSWANAIAVSADFRLALTACEDKLLKLWDLKRGVELRTLRGHRSSVIAVAMSTDGHLAVSASYDATLGVWDTDSGRLLHLLKGHKEPVNHVAMTRDGRLAVSGSDVGEIKVWDLRRGQTIYTVEGHVDSVSYLAISEDEQHFASASWDKTIKLWNVAKGSLVATFTCDGPALCCGFVNDRKLIVGDHLGRVHLLEIEPAKLN
jgi:WD40 repeat protein